MTTATKARKPQPRSARLMKLGAGLVLALTTGKDTVFYRLETLLAAAGRGFRLVKADRGDGPGEQYDVLLDGRRSSCECKGYLRWGHCKHLESLTALTSAGKIDAPAPTPESDTVSDSSTPAPPTPAPVETCGFCEGRGWVHGSMFDGHGYQRHDAPPLLTCEYCCGCGRCEDGGKLLPAD
jgi:hypothetical protein